MLKLRIAIPADAALVADLSRQTFFDTFAAQNTKADMDKFMREQFSRNKLMNEVGAAQNVFLIAENDGETVGYAKLKESGAPTELGKLASIEIARIYAVQSQIGKGVGNALMKKCIELAKERDKKVVWLGVWKENLRAIAFYKKWGFEIFAEHEFVLGNDVQKDWLMKKTL